MCIDKDSIIGKKTELVKASINGALTKSGSGIFWNTLGHNKDDD